MVEYFSNPAKAICDGGLCICSVQPQFVRDGSMSQFYQIRGATMLRLYESKQRMNDAIYCLEKAMENSQQVSSCLSFSLKSQKCFFVENLK